MKSKFLLVLVFILAFSISIFAHIKGRDVVDKGEVSEVNGVLISDGTEWYLESSNKKMLIHLGPEFYRDEIGLKLEESKFMEIIGYVYEDEVTPISVNYDGKEYIFRDKDGRPAWAGRGKRDGHYRENGRNENRRSFQNEGRGNHKNFQNQK